MEHLEWDRILQVHESAVEHGLHERRRQLLGGLPPSFVSTMKTEDDPSSQLLSDLSYMNGIEEIIGRVVPLERWARNACYLLSSFPDVRAFFRTVADDIAIGTKSRSTHTVPGETKAPVPEKIIFDNDMVNFGFLAGAQRTGQSVARLTVPRFEGGSAKRFPYSSDPMQYWATGWLIGVQHLITNYHVVNARNEGEAAASTQDLAHQTAGMSVQFDYDSLISTGQNVTGGRLIAYDAGLDYAIVELPSVMTRAPLTLWRGEVAIEKGQRVPVNIVQHPGGQPKQLGIRNNLIARIEEKNLAYFTDTEGGSSGSPVCTDDWTVLALHKAATQALGEIEYQGKQTAWVNIGTRIDVIVKDMMTRYPDVWDKIGAVFSP